MSDTASTQSFAMALRQDIIRMLVAAGSGHSGGPLGLADIVALLYQEILRHDPGNPQWPERDRFILSNGHTCPVLYAALAQSGYFPVEDLQSLRQFGSGLQGHPQRQSLAGIEVSSGPLGQGISQAVGMALGLRGDKNPARVYCLTSDGEHNEGQVWEALLCAAKYRLTNLTVIVDRNNIQIDGPGEIVMPLSPLREKYESFGWHVMEVDGHDIDEVREALLSVPTIVEKPVCLIAHTIPGKGVSFMEGKFEWHGKVPSPEEAYQALLELGSESQ